MCLYIVIVYIEIERASTYNVQPARYALALMSVLFLVRIKMFPIRRHTGGGKGVNTNAERVRIESNGGRQIGDGIVTVHEYLVRSF